MATARFHAHVHYGDGDSRVIAVFDPLVAGEQLAGLGNWVIRDVKDRLEVVDGVETRWEVWVDRVT
jgi:hypothetical protein